MPTRTALPPTHILKKQTLSVQIAERIIEEISNGGYVPGASLPSEQQLAADYGVSRPVVREAFKFLYAQGFVNVTTGKGASIREVNDELLRVFMRRVLAGGVDKDIVDLFELRITLEKVSVALAARDRSTQELRELKATLNKMTSFIDQPALYSEFDIKFHVLLARSSHNIFVFHLISSIRETLVSLGSRMRLELSLSQLPHVHEHHSNIYKAIEQRNPTLAVEAMEGHFETAIERLRKNLKSSHTSKAARKKHPREHA